MLNMVLLNGRLTSDPVIKDKYGYIQLAVQRAYKNKETGTRDSDFFTVFIHGEKQLDLFSKYFKKGDGITVQCRLGTKVTKGEDGKNKTDIVLSVNGDIIFDTVGKKPREASSAAPAAFAAAPALSGGSSPEFEELSLEDDDLPF